mmetsp:Transcript_19142/g.24837  ORF Transcript_19142/g.24837 Transcript_19142/m.24837 type:complete len:120 (-) Transcript_19142:376-735(-)
MTTVYQGYVSEQHPAQPPQPPVATVVSSGASSANNYPQTVQATTVTTQQPVHVVGQPAVPYAVIDSTQVSVGVHSRVVEEQYCGPVSCCIAAILVCLFWPAALCVPFCPCDRRERVVVG